MGRSSDNFQPSSWKKIGIFSARLRREDILLTMNDEYGSLDFFELIPEVIFKTERKIHGMDHPPSSIVRILPCLVRDSQPLCLIGRLEKWNKLIIQRYQVLFIKSRNNNSKKSRNKKKPNRSRPKRRRKRKSPTRK